VFQKIKRQDKKGTLYSNENRERLSKTIKEGGGVNVCDSTYSLMLCKKM